MSDNPLFRKSALEKLSSPERLDVLMQVTSPKGWLALWTIAAVLVCVIGWLIFGSIPERLDGVGILVRGGGLREIRASGDGTISGLTASTNDTVAENQVIGSITQDDLGEALKAAQSKYADAQQQYEAGAAEDNAAIAQISATIAGLQGQITATQSNLSLLQSDLAAKEQLLAKRVITEARVAAIRQQILAAQGQVAQLKGQIGSQRQSQFALQQKSRSRAAVVQVAQLEVERLSKNVTTVSRIASTVAGRIVELRKNVGDRVKNGEVVAIVEPPSSKLEPILFIDAKVGKQIRAGMEAQVQPRNVKREEYGFMKGKILSITDYPVTPERVRMLVANESLAADLLGKSSKFEVRIGLVEDTKTPSGYAWSSSQGPPFRVDGGTQLVVSVVVERRRPISMILPIIRGSLGAS